jgi:hypothetical protein
MLQLKDLERLVTRLGDRRLKPRDAGVFIALMRHTDTFTNRIHTTADEVAADLQINPSEARAAIGRLKREHLLRLIVEKPTGRRYYLLNPWVVQSGKPEAIGLAMKQFEQS